MSKEGFSDFLGTSNDFMDQEDTVVSLPWPLFILSMDTPPLHFFL